MSSQNSAPSEPHAPPHDVTSHDAAPHKREGAPLEPSWVERKTRWLLGLIYNAPLLVLMGCALLTALSLWGASDLKLKTKIQDLLPASAPSLQASEALNERLGSVDMLVVTLLSEELDQVKGALPKIAEALSELPDVESVRWRQDTALIEQNALITFASLEELKDAYQELSEEIRRRVSAKMSLFDEPSDQELGEGEGEGRLWPKAEELGEVGLSLSWAEWESEAQLAKLGASFRESESDYPELFYNSAYNTLGLKVFPKRSSSDLAFCEQIVREVEETTRRAIEEALGPIGAEGVVKRVDLGGSYRHLLKEASKIKGDMLTSTLASFALLTLVLIIAFRSLRGFVSVMLPLVMGTAWSVGLTALLVGSINLITAFIFAVLLGLGIDFGIHFYGRYREERALGHDDLEAMVQTHLSSGHASLLASSTTIASFLALTFADFKGLSQFGAIAAMGVASCLLAVLIALPAVVFAWAKRSPLKLNGYELERAEEGARRPFPLGAKTALIGVLIGLVGLALSPQIQRELNFNELGPHPKPSAPEDPQEMSYKSLQYGTTKATSPTVILAGSAQEARALYEQLEALKKEPTSRISSAQSLFSLIPEQQEEKIKWVARLCRKLKRKVKLFEGDERAGAEELLTHCEPRTFSADELPQWVKDKFTDRQGEVGSFVFISPRGSTSDGEVALEFHAEMQRLKTSDGSPPVVAGRAMVWAEVLMAIDRDGPLSFGAALLVVLLLVWLFERSLIGLLFVAAPLTLGLGVTVGLMVLFEIKLNFFNMLALPTLIGMGVDDGVHMHHRYRELGRHSARYIVKTTGFAASLTTLTTSIGFASLMLADHRGLNSLGLVSVLGMSAALLATLLIVPALFTWRDLRLDRAERESSAGSPLSALLVLMSLVALSFSALSGCDSASTPRLKEPVLNDQRDASVDVGWVTRDGAPPVEDMRLTPDQAPPDAMMSPLDMSPPTPTQPCASACDCEAGLDCVEGRCARGASPVYCCRQRPCPEGASCRDERGALRECGACQSACDCPLGQACEGGLCVSSEQAVYCCDRSPCPTGASCEGPSGAGTCAEGCVSACDCWRGQGCVEGRCQDVPGAPSYCCERALCPQGVSCERDDGSSGVCPVRACRSACDCPRGQACVEGECELSAEAGLVLCCEGGDCPLGQACDTLEGTRSTCSGEPECNTVCDCLTGFSCLEGRCELGGPNDQLTLCCDKDECAEGLLCQWSSGVLTSCE